MNQTLYRYKEQDLAEIDQQVRKITEACNRLSSLSSAKGGIPAVDGNLIKITASLKNIANIGDILEILREGSQEVIKDK